MAVFVSTLGKYHNTQFPSPCGPHTDPNVVHVATHGPVVTMVSATISSGSPPPGLEPFVCVPAQSALYMVGVPTALGVYAYVIDTLMSNGSHLFWSVTSHTIQLAAGCPLITISPASPLPDVFDTEPISIPLSAAGGTAPYTWAVAEGSTLPAGLALSAGGVLSGAATTPGSYTFAIRATATGGCVGIKVYALEVLAIDPITLDPPTLPNGTRGVGYLELVTAEGGIGVPYVFTLEDGALPPGVELDEGGAIFGLPTEAGSYTFTVRATDGGANFGEEEYTIAIAGLRIVIDGEDVTPEIAACEIELGLNRQATATLEIGDDYVPARGVPVLIYARDGVTPIFGGIVLTRRLSGMTDNNPANKGSIDCVDASIFFDDADPVTLNSPTTEDLEDVIASIVAQSLAVYGITYTPTATGITVPPRTDWTDLTVPDAFKRITDATGIVFRTDPLRALKVFRPLDDPAPVTITDANLNAFALSWADPPSLPRNTVDLLCGPTGNGVTTQEWTADGIETSWEVDIQAVIGDYYPGARAHAFLGPTGPGNFAAGETVTLGSSTYTLRASLVGDVAGEVLIGADINASLANLVAAIVDSGAPVYAPSTPVNADADGFMRYPDQLAVNALAIGVAGNSIAVSTSSAAAFWYGEGTIPLSTLQLGADPAGAAGWTQGYILENGVLSQTLGSPPGAGAYYSWDVTAGRGTVAVDAGATPAAGTVLRLVYLAVFPFHARVSSGSPPITFREDHPEIVDYAAGIALATQILVRESANARELDVFTDVDGFLPGQELDVNTTYRDGLVAAFLVATVRILLVNAELWEYRIAAQETDEYAGSFVEQWKALTSGGSSSSSSPGTLTAGGPINAGDIYSDGRTSFRADQSMGGNRLTFVEDPAAPQDAATKAYVDAAAPAGVILADGTVPMAAPLDLDGFPIENLDDPTNPQDAATKAYVDANGGGAGNDGGLVLLEERSASASASINLTTRNVAGKTGATFQSDFDEYLIELVGILPATNNVGLQLRVSSNGGSSWASGAADYRWSIMAYGSGGPGNANSTGATSINLNAFSNYSNTALRPMNAHLRLFAPRSSTAYKMISGLQVYWDQTPTFVTSEIGGAYQSATPIDAFQLFASSGNITSGIVRVYGIDKTGAAAVGAIERLAQVITAGSQATVDFSAIPAGYSAIRVEWFSRDTQAGTGSVVMRARINNDNTAANYTAAAFSGIQSGVALNSTNAASAGGVFVNGNPQNGNAAGITGAAVLQIIGYADTTFHKRIDSHGSWEDGTTALSRFQFTSRWKSAAAINRITFTTDGTAFLDGSTFTLYGVK